MGAAVVLASAALASFIGLNFTGSSTFTSQPGANLELEKSIVPIIASSAPASRSGLRAHFRL